MLHHDKQLEKSISIILVIIVSYRGVCMFKMISKHQLNMTGKPGTFIIYMLALALNIIHNR